MDKTKIVFGVLLLCIVVATSRRQGNRRSRHGYGAGYGNETVIESERNGDDHFIRIVLPDNGFMTDDVDDGLNKVESAAIDDANNGDTSYDLRRADSPPPPELIEAYRMSEMRGQWTQAQVRWARSSGCATGYRIRYIAELSAEESDLESFRAMSDTVRVAGTVDWVDLSAAGRILAVSIATECEDRYGPYSGAYELKAPSEHPDRVEIQDIRSRSTTALEVALSCRALEARGIKFLVMAHRLNRAGQRKPGATKTWSFPGISGPIFNLTGLRPRSTYEVEVRMERYTMHGDRYGPWSENVQADTLSSKHDQMVMVRNTAVPVRMYGPPLNLTYIHHALNTVSIYWKPPQGVGPCMGLPLKYRITCGPVEANRIPESIRDAELSMRLIPRAVFKLKRNDEIDYMFQIVALDRDLIPSLWASDLLIVSRKERP